MLTISRDRTAVLLIAIILTLTLAGCSLFGGGSDEAVEDRLQDTGINDIELDFRPDLLDQKLENVEPDENGVFEVTFTEAEVNNMILIRDRDEPASEQEDLQNLFIRFEEDEVLLDSDLGALFDDLLVVRFTPSVVDGALQLDLDAASVGSIEVPTQFLNGLESAMNSGLNAIITNIPAPNTLREVEVEDGAMTLVAQQDDAQ